MRRQRLLIAGLVSLSAAAPLVAQSAGNVELGGFGQFTRADGAWQVKNGYGLGGLGGVFLTSRWELAGDVSFATFNNKASRGPGTSDMETFVGRIAYNLPFGFAGRTHRFLLEPGVGTQRFNSHADFLVSPAVGARFTLTDFLTLRLDAVLQYVESPGAATFGFPQTPGVNSEAARSTNLDLRAGLTFFLGNTKMSAPPPAPAPAPVQAPPPRREPPPPPPARVEPTPPDRSGIIRDSLAAVDRAREAVLAKVYFDLDRSELRDDQRAILDAKVPVLRANPGVRIRIEGNADERGSDEHNMALGMSRAQAARKYLIDHGIDAGRIDISSNGEEKGVCQDHNEACWSQNRRDEFVIVAGGSTMIAPR